MFNQKGAGHTSANRDDVSPKIEFAQALKIWRIILIETNSYYTSNSKTERPRKQVVHAPDKIPVTHVFNDKDAQAKMDKINQDIYVKGEKEKKKEKVSMLTFIGGFTALVLAFIGIKRIFRKS